MINTEPWAGGTDEEYETQQFGFGAQRMKIAVRQMVQQKITTCVIEMQSFLQESLNLNDTDKATLSKSCDKLVQLYCERAKPSMNAIDEEIEKIVSIPPNVLLPGDEVQSEQLTDDEYSKLKDEVMTLRKKVERGALMEALLTAEEDELAAIEGACEIAKKDMEQLDMLHTRSQQSDELKTLLNDTQMLCASVPFMKETNDVLDLIYHVSKPNLLKKLG